MKKGILKAAGIAAVVTGVVAIGTQFFTPAPVVSKGTVYNGRLFIAGHGGHIAVADVAIGAQLITYRQGDGELSGARWPKLAAYAAAVTARPAGAPILAEESAALAAAKTRRG